MHRLYFILFIRRLIELKLSVERGDYQKSKQTFNDLVAKYKPSKERKALILRVHLMSEFSGKNYRKSMLMHGRKIKPNAIDLPQLVVPLFKLVFPSLRAV